MLCLAMQVCYGSRAEVFGVCFGSFPGLEAGLASRRILSLVSGKGFLFCFLCAFGLIFKPFSAAGED